MFEYINNVSRTAARLDDRAKTLAEVIALGSGDLTKARYHAMRRALARAAARAADRHEALAGIRRRAILAAEEAAEVAAANWKLNAGWDPAMKGLVEPAVRRLAAALGVNDDDDEDIVVGIFKTGALRGLTRAEMVGLRFCFTGR